MKKSDLTKAGEIPLAKRLAKKYTPTQSQLQLLETAAAIHDDPKATDTAYLARQLVLCTLPHANPGDVPVWSRQCGSVTLSIQPYIDRKTGQSIGYPYGIIPRLLLFWLTTEAVRTGSRRLVLGKRLSDFMRAVGLNPATGGGKRGDAKRLTEQARRLFRSTISFEEATSHDNEHGEAWADMPVASKGQLWWDHTAPEQGSLWESWVELSEGFYEAIMTAPVPFDIRALKALKRSPISLDLYAWCCYTAFAIIAKQLGPQFISWSRLQQQFGTNYADTDNFKKAAQAALRKVVIVYPGLTIKPQSGGFTIHASPLAVDHRRAVKKPVDRKVLNGETVPPGTVKRYPPEG